MCLVYLLQFDTPFTESRVVCHDIHLDYPLSPYAAEQWTHHARSVGCSSARLQRLIMALLNTKKPMYINWLTLHVPDDPWNVLLDEDPTGSPLYYASFTGLEIPS
ncbi:hypothetical protein JB92DRAFT_692282 [Gautieria morchelliformis]|nr:hypothetical protein JB92DRAFT_692282 [Gautieria morchelliformis]